MEKVIIAFVTESSRLTEKHWLNAAAARLAPSGTVNMKSNIIHCECFFPSSTHLNGKAYGIFWSGEVWCNTSKRYSNKDYLFKSIAVTKKQKLQMMSFLDNQIGKGFNHLGFLSFATPCRISGNLPGIERKFYCSQLTMAALNASGIFGEGVYLPENIHPHQVFLELTHYSTAVQHPKLPKYSALTF